MMMLLKYVRDYALEQNAKPIELDREITIISQDDEFTYRYKDYELETILFKYAWRTSKRKCFVGYYSTYRT